MKDTKAVKPINKLDLWLSRFVWIGMFVLLISSYEWIIRTYFSG
tara:strand:+ start:2681 stop:2812 length:132 start_codon:yes stop_codon:yes gene_type:complete